MPTHAHATVEIPDKVLERTNAAAKSVRVIAGSEAFRRYQWLSNIRPTNASLNFRGMVVSSRWATVYNFSGKWLKPAEKVAVFASLAANIYKARGEIGAILDSKDDWSIKGAKLSTQVTSVSLRTAGGVIPFGAHVIATSLGGYLGAADFFGFHKAADWQKSLQSIDSNIQTGFDQVTDGKNIYLVVNQTVDYWSR